MNKKSSICVFLYKSKTLAVTFMLGATITLSAPIVADASVTEKTGVSEKTGSSENTGLTQQAKQQKKELSEKWGIELIGMRSTAYGHMLDFRYRVLDAEKAAPLFVRKTKPYLIHQDSGKALAVPNTPKLGSLRNTNMPQQGRTYWMFFGNSHGVVKKGDKVTVAIGDFRATDLEVE
mgnify:CR=1 FL=1